MIPKIHIIQWRNHAPWPTDEQVEQDLILSRILCELYSESDIAENLLFRGGTALHKLYFSIAGRYSEDIDLVQIQARPIGILIDTIRNKLDPWLDVPKRKAGGGKFTLYYRFDTSSDIPAQRKIKIEINTREHFTVLGISKKEFNVNSSWFKSGNNMVSTYKLEELIATKLRALYQRKKGRDLFDIWLALQQYPNLKIKNIVKCFKEYTKFEGIKINRKEFEKNLLLKKEDPVFTTDLSALLLKSKKKGDYIARYNISDAIDVVMDSLIIKI